MVVDSTEVKEAFDKGKPLDIILPILMTKIEDRFINGTSEREPIGLLNKRSD
ncbi:hypothetical protein [Carnobacterium divergens]|uniref:hypothetical protein n=1 Tax=Carnobacterium divergens TaxID=2748 RepID=UPI001431F133|nr:hypothetical protein [Carnobacterium divergens]